MVRPRPPLYREITLGEGGPMTERMTISELDLRRLLGIAAGHRDESSAEGLPLSQLSELTDLIRCDEASFFLLDSRTRAGSTMQAIPAEDGQDDDQPFWAHYWDSRPCSYPDRSGDLRSVTSVSDFYSARQWHETGMYRDYFRPAGIEHELMMCLAAGSGSAGGPGRSVRLIFFRGPGLDFGERDRGLLALLRPHLHEAYRAAELRRRGQPQLTRRQRELLRLVAVGYTNAQVGRRLGVSEGTVRRHLENIYTRLQVSSRTAAVARAFPDRIAV
jgi:DNA-binding CsgD family transcriptional regulator